MDLATGATPSGHVGLRFPYKNFSTMSQPDPAVPAAPAPASRPIWPALFDYFVKNPFLVLWNVALISGGLIAFTHFASIRYFPDLDVKTASSFLLGIALFGVSMISVLAFVLVIPSHLLRNEVWRPYYLLAADAAGQDRQQEADDIVKKRRLPFMTLSLFHGLAAFSFFVFIACAFIFTGSDVQYRRTIGGICLACFVAAVAAIAGFDRFWRKQDMQYGPSIGRSGHGRRERHVTLASIWWLMAPGFLILLILSAGRLDRADAGGHACVAVFAVLLIVANCVLAIKKFESARAYWGVAGIAVFLLSVYLIIPSNPLNITRAVFASLAIGDVGSSQFVVKRPTCDAVNLIVPGACEVAGDNVGCIRPDSLANRIGSEYLLVLKVRARVQDNGTMLSDGIGIGTTVNVPIPKSEVLAWGSVERGSIAWKPCGGAAKAQAQAGRPANPGS